MLHFVHFITLPCIPPYPPSLPPPTVTPLPFLQPLSPYTALPPPPDFAGERMKGLVLLFSFYAFQRRYSQQGVPFSHLFFLAFSCSAPFGFVFTFQFKAKNKASFLVKSLVSFCLLVFRLHLSDASTKTRVIYEYGISLKSAYGH